jgi:FkbM family methyltransferase
MRLGRSFVEPRFLGLLDRAPPAIARRLHRASFGARLLRPLVNALAPRGPATVQVRSGVAKGVRLVIKPREEKYYWTGTHEPEVQLAFARELAPGTTVWDVGAHVGFYTVLASRAVGDLGHVHAFEPSPENRLRLLEALRLNDAQNVVVHEVALAARSGSAPLYRHRFSTSWTLVEARGDEPDSEVACTTIDELAGALGVPDLIKIDAEGAELDVLRGGVNALRATDTVLIVEFSALELVGEAQALLPGHRFEQLAERHWLLRPRHAR